MFNKILLPIDLSAEHSWRKALPSALEVLKEGGELHVVTVLPDIGASMVGQYFREGYMEEALHNAGEALSDWVGANVPENVTVHPHVLSGRIYTEILSAANKVEADLIVMASHSPELTDYLIGPNASHVVRHAPQSVMVIRE